MLDNKYSITRNPLDRIRKVFKYEFINASKILLPLYSIVLILGFLSGLTEKKHNINFQMNFQNNMGSHSFSSTNSMPEQFISSLFGLFSIFAIIVAGLVTISILSKRFKKGMLGEEAYFNLTLPVTIAEHLWGRLFAYLCWLFIGFIIVTIACYLSFIRVLSLQTLFSGIHQFHSYLGQNNISIPIFYIEIFLIFIVVNTMIILFVFCVNSIAHLSKTHRTLVKIFSIILIIVITEKIWNFIYNVQFLKSFTNGAGMFILVNIIICAIYMTITQIIFTKELNLE